MSDLGTPWRGWGYVESPRSCSKKMKTAIMFLFSVRTIGLRCAKTLAFHSDEGTRKI